MDLPLPEAEIFVGLMNTRLDGQIERLCTQFCDLWNRMSDSPIPSGRQYSSVEKKENELRMEGLLRDMQRHPTNEDAVARRISRFRDFIRDLVLETVDERTRFDINTMLRTFSDAGDDFVRKSREFDGQLRFDGIFQSLRNLWIINSMQEAFGIPVCTNPSAVAYSLLYTYTDNFLDSAEISAVEKRDFSRRFGMRLAGLTVTESTELFSKISSLVSLIEGEYPRTLYPGVFASLLAIHRAQQGSLQQRPDTRNDGQPGILRLSVEKGGTSVVADAFVAKGRLTEAETSFAFGYGAFLQFVDDLQDVDEDRAKGSETLFTQASARGSLDATTNRLIHYLREIMLKTTPLEGPRSQALTELILQGSLGLILESIALAPEKFSAGYVRRAELLSPLGFEAIRDMHSRRPSMERDFDTYIKSPGSHTPLSTNDDLQEEPSALRFQSASK